MRDTVMAGSVNKVILIGNLGRDPEVRSTQDGKELVNMTVATTESWRDKATGERRDKTEWHRVVIFNTGLVNIAKQYLKKGSKVYLEGALQTRKWQDQSGAERYSTEVVLQNFSSNLTMLDNRGAGEAGGYQQSSSSSSSSYGQGGSYDQGAPAASAPQPSFAEGSVAEEIDDEIPF